MYSEEMEIVFEIELEDRNKGINELRGIAEDFLNKRVEEEIRSEYK